MAANGRLPSKSLRRIPGNGRLRRDCARAWIALTVVAAGRGADLKLWEGPIRRTYRPLAAQWLAWRTLPRGQAAFPGTSNHGWGLAIDLMSQGQRSFVDGFGRRFGWAKVWSDASHEWWHLKWRAGVWSPPPPVRLTPKERRVTQRLRAKRRIAKRNGGWSRISRRHLREAVRHKNWIRQRRALMRREARRTGPRYWRRADRRRRYRYLGRALSG